MHSQLARVLLEWESLWTNVYRDDEDLICRRWYDLQEKTSMITESASSQFPLFEELAKRCEREAYSYRQYKHAPAAQSAQSTPTTQTA